MSLSRAIILKSAAFGPVERLVRRSFLFRPVVRRFIAGDTLEEAMVQSEALCDRGFLVSLDNLGENTTNERDALAAVERYRTMLDRIAASPHRRATNVSIKLTQCGFDLGDEFCERQLRDLLRSARERDNFVHVDMESSAYTERTIAMIERVFPEFPNTGTVLQSYLRRTTEDCHRLIRLGCRIRLVKGAYLEPATVAYQSKREVDRMFVEHSKLLIREAAYPAIATHDERIVRAVCAWANAERIPKERYEIQFLYGIRRDLQQQLLEDGYNVRIYVPYGDSWYPYFTRRLAERPANVAFILKAAFRR
jgi:proline dehydrogenase